jgi:hypothetical protein
MTPIAKRVTRIFATKLPPSAAVWFAALKATQTKKNTAAVYIALLIIKLVKTDQTSNSLILLAPN